jgi:hypothetical protein
VFIKTSIFNHSFFLYRSLNFPHSLSFMIKPNKLTAFEPPEKSLTYVKYLICLLLWSYVAYRAICLS